MSWFSSSKDNKNDNYIHEAIQRHHETQRNNYYRREVIRANEERRLEISRLKYEPWKLIPGFNLCYFKIN